MSPADPDPLSKEELRRTVRARIAAIDRRQRRIRDAAICGLLAAQAGRRRFEWVLGYLALRDEVCVDAALAAFVAAGLRVYVPSLQPEGLRVGRWRPTTALSRDRVGVLAPRGADIDGFPPGPGLVLVPGRGFDGHGGRVGRGGGWYDRLLAEAGPSVTAVGVAYACQVFGRVPAEGHDRRVHWVASEDGKAFGEAAGARGTEEER